MMARHIREVVGTVKTLGATVVDLSRTGKNHYKLTLGYDGKSRFFIVSSSPSDCHSLKNLKGDIVRWLRQVGK
jgi:hypothetical protein